MLTVDTEITQFDLDADGILTITLNRPDKLNALSPAVFEELITLFEEARSNLDVRAILITGTGKAFCAGTDIKRLLDLDANTGRECAEYGQHVFRLLETCGKPSLAALNGMTLGGGCELAMAASLRIATEHTIFGQPEVKLGLIPGYGGTQRLARLVGKGRAIDLCITGRTIDAQIALNWGLVNEIVAADKLLDTSKEWLRTILQQSPHAISLALETIDRGFDMPLDEALNLEAMQFGFACASPEKQEGVSAFLEKRNADFRGKG